MQFLKANATATVLIGPAVDVVDGFTPETGLAIGTVDACSIYKHDATAEVDLTGTSTLTHRADGYYTCTLSASDTDTEGRLTLLLRDDSVCLPLWITFMVLAEAAYNSMFTAKDTGYMDVDVKNIEGSDATDQIRDSVVDDSTRIDATALNTHSAITAAGIVNEWESQSQADPTGFHVNVKEVNGTAQTANDNAADINSILTDTNEIQGKLPTNKFMGSSDGADDDGNIASILAGTVTNAQGADVATDVAALIGTDSKALISTDAQDLSATLDVNAKTITNGAISATTLAADTITEAKIADDAIATEHLATGAISADTLAADTITAAKIATDAIGADEMADDAIDAAAIAASVGAEIAASVWDEATSGHTTAGTFGEQAAGILGPGDYEVTLTIQTTGGAALAGVEVWLNTDADRTDSVVQKQVTSDSGIVTFWLDYATTYNIYCHKAGYSFANASMTPAAGSVAFTKLIGTAQAGSGTSSYYDQSFLTRAVAACRQNIDEPDIDAKYSDAQIIDKIESAYALIIAEINRNARNPIVAKYEITIAASTTEYIMPQNIGSIIAIYQQTTNGARIFYDSRSNYNELGKGLWVEGNVLHIQAVGIFASSTTITVEYVPDGTARLIEGTCTLDADFDVATLGATPNAGTLDTRLHAYTGSVLRIIRSSGTNDYIQERTITSYDHTTRAATLELALNPDPGDGGADIYYEICPAIHKGLDDVIPVYAAYLIAGIEGNTRRSSTILGVYRNQLRNLRLSHYYAIQQTANKGRPDNYNNRRYRPGS